MSDVTAQTFHIRKDDIETLEYHARKLEKRIRETSVDHPSSHYLHCEHNAFIRILNAIDHGSRSLATKAWFQPPTKDLVRAEGVEPSRLSPTSS